MPTPILRARWLAPALLLAVAGCSQPSAQARLQADQAATDPPQLWRVEALDARGAIAGELLVCADTPLRQGFARANAELGGRPCVPLRGGVERPSLYAVRCQLDGTRYGLTVSRAGDLTRDFTAAFAFTALDGTGRSARQMRRYRQVGACPPGWGIGDQARPGAPPHGNALGPAWSGS